MSGQIYIATETFASAHVANTIRKGVTRVREGHLLLQHHPQFFRPLGKEEDDRVDFEVESVREPSSAAQVSEPVGDGLEEMNRASLDDMAEKLGIAAPASLPNKAAVIAAIRDAR